LIAYIFIVINIDYNYNLYTYNFIKNKENKFLVSLLTFPYCTFIG